MNNTYPEPYRSAKMNTIADPSGCYNRQCVSYTNWKVKEATGNWLPRPGSMNANNWDDYAAGWGFFRVDNPISGGKYYGQTDNGTYGHTVWVEEVLADGRIRISEYNYIKAGEYSERIISANAYRWFQVIAPPAPSTDLRDANDQDLADIWAGKYGNMPEREQNLRNAGINPINAQARINAGEGGWYGFVLGDSVVPTKLVDYNGTSLKQYDDVYTITELKGNRAVLSARGAVWAAMNTDSIRKV